MSFDKELAKELEEIVVHGLSELPIPYEKGKNFEMSISSFSSKYPLLMLNFAYP